MYNADEVEDLLETWKLQGISKWEQVRLLSAACLGWPYVYGAYGQMCTPQTRRNYAGYNPGYREDIYKPCPVLSCKQDTCDGCPWDGVRCFDCRGFTRWVLSQVGVNLFGGGATTQWETSSNWVARGTIDTLPQDFVCCLFKHKDGCMSHTGLYLGDGNIIHCSGTVKTGTLPGRPAWTNWAIPAGLYADEDLRVAGIKVTGSNVPTLRRGSEGEDVRKLQARIGVKVDGIFGAKTEAAVKSWQAAHGLTADGIVGAKTRAAMGLDSIAPVPVIPPENSQETAPEPEGVWLTMEEWRTIKAAFSAAEAVIKKHEG